MLEEIKELDPDGNDVDFRQMILKVNEIVRVLNAYEITARIGVQAGNKTYLGPTSGTGRSPPSTAAVEVGSASAEARDGGG